MTSKTGLQARRTVRARGLFKLFNSRSLIALVLAAFTTLALAIQPVAPPQRGAQVKLQRAIIAKGLDVEPALEATTSLAAAASQRPAVAAFLARQGGSWEMRWDSRSDRPNLIQGSGVPLIPGNGNTLTRAELGLAAGDEIDLATVETRLTDFIAANSDLLGSKGMEFHPDPGSSTAYGKDNSHWFVEFEQFHDGVRVEGANLFFRIAAGNIIQFGSYRVAPVREDTHPVSTPQAALALALGELAFPAGTQVQELINDGELLLLPLSPAGDDAGESFAGVAGSGYEHELVWRFVFRVNDDQTTYQVLVDAHSNRVIDVRDLNTYANATVTGGVYPTTNTDPETVVPMPFAAVTNGGAKVTDALGIYDYSGGTATVTLDGKYFRMSDNCGSISLSNATDGNLAFGSSGGTDCTTPGVGGAGNTHASRSGFYHLTNINRKASTFLPGNSWIAGKVTANMNIDDTCNAYWNGSSLNFFKSGGGCSNTGEISAVFLHEWGHGMDTNSGGSASDMGSGEAVGDTFAFLETKDACIGKNFKPGVPCYNCDATCTGVRDVKAFSTLGAATIAKPSNVTSDSGINCDRYACPYYANGISPYQGPMGYEGHCESYIASSANWDLAQALVGHYGSTQGWQEMDRIWYSSLTPSKAAYRVASGGTCNASASVDGCGSNNWYTVFLAADDDNGNLSDGTPNGCRIWDAFSAHGIACGTRPACSADVPDFTLAVTPTSQGVCANPTASTSYTVNVGSQMGFSSPVVLAASGLPAGISASFSPGTVTPGGTSTMTVNVNGAAAGTATLTVDGTASGSPGHSASAQLVVTTGVASAPILSTPGDGNSGTSTTPTLTWSAAAGASSYTIEIATDSAFTNIVQTASGLTATSYTATTLSPLTTYYWRVKAVNTCGETVSTMFSFTTANLICSTVGAAIPDNNTTGVSNSITVTDTSTLTNLKVSIKGTHTWVGDLKFQLSRGAGNVMLVDRPGYTGSGFGCSNNDFDIVLDDAATTPVEGQCNATPPALSGTVSPNNPINSVFAGAPFNGTWTLTATDNAGGDTGSLAEWCLIPTTATGATYTVGGNVSGLTGSGLLLSLNAGAQSLPVAADGAFTFPTGLASGASYAVTVGTQPAGQVCSVSNGSGTIGSANVTDVAVTCTAAATYTVGGNVSGLTGSGLVLSLNAGAQSLPVAADGAFTFPTGLANGASYAVTVGTQPTGQTCSVASGSGTISGANVTNVAVSCVTNTYTVGGNVSGLTGLGLVLALDAGAQSLPIAANGTFTFPTAVADGTTYTVTIATQPSGQTCAVANGSGTISGANVTNVAVTCVTIPTWTVGGSILGLSANGLVLSLNAGAQTIAITSGVTAFSFPNGLTNGAAYAVTVQTQPGNLYCYAQNGSGTIAGANVTNVVIDCTDRIFADGFQTP
ncbi:proprotein convertase P-domain-containing protein [Dokdonella sp.]|uniref:fibronectin type III domain-containing protein n=1 Tax=Dokdonella sp. TaxID=2291710 RepID=UPI0025C12CB7|nr:proprotein convertase P-domain-containing protein [Dokdonella sp.]MBX3689056.1 hypothetical protein [Dokdonella sp.]